MQLNEETKTAKQNLLVYAQYYHPDMASTGQLLKELCEGMLPYFNMTVICVVPSYDGRVPPEYRAKKYYFENLHGVKIIRIRVPEFVKTKKISRVKNIITYFFRALIATKKTGKQDYVYSISQPPILGGLLGVYGKRMKKAKLIYNIQDFNPEQIMAIGYSKNKLLLKVMLWLDKYSCKNADKVIVVGRDMIDTLKKRFQKECNCPPYTFINNWSDEKEVYPLKKDHPQVVRFKKKYGLENKFVIMYSGNIGLYYDLENLMNVLERFPSEIRAVDGRRVVFAFIGDGSICNKLKSYKETHHMENVFFIPYQDKKDLIYSLNAGDIHWCINAKGIKGISVPSKLYGIMAAGKPVLAILEEGSEARIIVEASGCGLICEPGNYDQINKSINKCINMSNKERDYIGDCGRMYLTDNLTREASIKKYIKEIINC